MAGDLKWLCSIQVVPISLEKHIQAQHAPFNIQISMHKGTDKSTEIG